MKDRLKWILVGLGFTFGLQVVISLIFMGIAFSAARSGTGTQETSISTMVFGVTLGAFLVGGLVVGWMSDDLRLGDAVIVALLTLILSAGINALLPDAARANFVTGLLLSDASAHIGRVALFALLAIVAAGVGAYLGWHVGVPQEGMFDRVALLLGLLGAVVGPFILLALGGSDANQPNLPWYFLAIVLVAVLAIVAVGFFMFTRESHDAEEISISPDRREV